MRRNELNLLRSSFSVDVAYCSTESRVHHNSIPVSYMYVRTYAGFSARMGLAHGFPEANSFAQADTRVAPLTGEMAAVGTERFVALAAKSPLPARPSRSNATRVLYFRRCPSPSRVKSNSA